MHVQESSWNLLLSAYASALINRRGKVLGAVKEWGILDTYALPRAPWSAAQVRGAQSLHEAKGLGIGWRGINLWNTWRRKTTITKGWFGHCISFYRTRDLIHTQRSVLFVHEREREREIGPQFDPGGIWCSQWLLTVQTQCQSAKGSHVRASLFDDQE